MKSNHIFYSLLLSLTIVPQRVVCFSHRQDISEGYDDYDSKELNGGIGLGMEDSYEEDKSKNGGNKNKPLKQIDQDISGGYDDYDSKEQTGGIGLGIDASYEEDKTKNDGNKNKLLKQIIRYFRILIKQNSRFLQQSRRRGMQGQVQNSRRLMQSIKSLNESQIQNSRLLRELSQKHSKDIAKVNSDVKIANMMEKKQQEGIAKLNSTVHTIHDYQPKGVQTNVTLKQVTDAGWRKCWDSQYIASITDLRDIEQAVRTCKGPKIMMACGIRDKEYNYKLRTLDLLAWAPREFIFKHTTGQGHVANQVRWYRSVEIGKHSWGFAPASDVINLSTCDIEQKDREKRLCWHTDGTFDKKGQACGTAVAHRLTLWRRVLFELYE